MSVLDFKGYTVTQMAYSKNAAFDQVNRQISLNPKLSEKHIIEDSSATINLRVVAGSDEGDKLPFSVSCEVQGKFIYNFEEDENNLGAEVFVRNNGVAILYPYVRAIIGNLTAFSNEFPGFFLPTINVAKALADKANQQNESN
ncbi:protein-export chaperone SecB [Lacticaseibacillus mingshuiensis]|uniref:protein-export chaperone SecB n=1 Tax=Lacticaseibacillus mingshuiensis TaxID=2799574 RepID=UPI0019526955|nr:protein-export chaperone SecB [Lacticaseibacillus mingshuiensis]